MLAHMAAHSDGATVRVNRALVCANADLAGALAARLAARASPKALDLQAGGDTTLIKP
jgi:hypothetical protein